VSYKIQGVAEGDSSKPASPWHIALQEHLWAEWRSKVYLFRQRLWGKWLESFCVWNFHIIIIHTILNSISKCAINYKGRRLDAIAHQWVWKNVCICWNILTCTVFSLFWSHNHKCVETFAIYLKKNSERKQTICFSRNNHNELTWIEKIVYLG